MSLNGSGSSPRSPVGRDPTGQDQFDQLTAKLNGALDEKHRVTFERDRLLKELQQAQNELHMNSSKLEKVEKDKSHLLREIDGLHHQMTKVKFESSSQAHELRSQILALERERDTLQFNLASTMKDVNERDAENHATVDKLHKQIQDSDRQHEAALAKLHATNSSLRKEISQLRVELSDAEVHVDNARVELAATRGELSSQTEALLEQASVMKERMRKQRETFNIEREGYATLVDEGRRLVLDLKHYETLFVGRQDETLYRNNKDAVKTWLNSIGLERLYQPLDKNGFRTLETLAEITEEDLEKMKVLAGTRRKFFLSLRELQEQLNRVPKDKRLQEDKPIRNALDDLYVWLNDVDASVTVEVPEQTNLEASDRLSLSLRRKSQVGSPRHST